MDNGSVPTWLKMFSDQTRSAVLTFAPFESNLFFHELRQVLISSDSHGHYTKKLRIAAFL